MRTAGEKAERTGHSIIDSPHRVCGIKSEAELSHHIGSGATPALRKRGFNPAIGQGTARIFLPSPWIPSLHVASSATVVEDKPEQIGGGVSCKNVDIS